MAKLNYLEVVDMLGETIKPADRKRLDHIIARKKSLKEEDKDLDEVLDGVLREIRGEADHTTEKV